MMQNDAPAPAPSLTVLPIDGRSVAAAAATELNGTTTADDFRQVMSQLEEMKEKPLFSEDELEEATEEDDLLDDEDYNQNEFIRQYIERLKESRRQTGFVDDDDDDYYDDYSAEQDGEEEKKRSQAKQAPVEGGPQARPDGDDSVMQDYLSNIKSKSAPHRFKSKFDEFDDGDGEGGELLAGGTNRKLRKNDSIKIISTPNGKVGIVYKVEPKAPEDEKGAKPGEGTSAGAGATAGSDQRQNKITPVITADGKVALLYRGASDNGETFRNKYEPITAKDILQLIDNNNNSNGSATTDGAIGGASGGGGSNTNNSIKNITNNTIYNSHKHYDNSYDSFNSNIKNNVIVDSARPEAGGDDSRENNAASGVVRVPTVTPYPWAATTTPMSRGGGIVRTPTTSAPSSTTPSNHFFGTVEDPAREVPLDGGVHGASDRQENSLLINRPLSEVLGIRKNQYLETNTIKIPNIETSTNKMRITNNNNLLSSLLHNLYQHGAATNGTEVPAGGPQHHHNHHPHDRLAGGHRAHAEEEQRRAGYSVNGFSRSRFYINRRTTPALPPRVIKEEESEEETIVTGPEDDNALPEVVNLAIIPAFEHEIDEKYIRSGYGGDFHRRHRHQYNVAPGQPAVHCAMQALVACAVMATFFGIIGTYFRSRVVDHIRVLYW